MDPTLAAGLVVVAIIVVVIAMLTTPFYIWGPLTLVGAAAVWYLFTAQGAFRPAPGVLDVSTQSVPQATSGQAYNVRLSAQGGQLPYTWSVTGLPAGMRSTTTNNQLQLSGTPQPTGDFPLTVTVRDNAGASASRDFTITVQTSPNATATPAPTAAVAPTPIVVIFPTPPLPLPTPGATVAPTGQFPTTPAEAATTFGGDASRWERNPDGGWHLREEAFTTLLNPKGFLGEGYFDTKPGKNPDAFVFTAPVAVQGATIWPEAGNRSNAEVLQNKMAIPKWDDGTVHPVRILVP